MQNKQKVIIQQYIQAYNQFDVAAMLQNLHPDIQFQNVSNGQVDLETNGIAEFKAQAEKAKQYFSQRQQSIRGWVFHETFVTIDIAYEGVLAIDLPNGMKVGETLRLEGRSEFTFKENQIIGIRDVA